jgi:hypothetical protein
MSTRIPLRRRTFQSAVGVGIGERKASMNTNTAALLRRSGAIVVTAAAALLVAGMPAASSPVSHEIRLVQQQQPQPPIISNEALQQNAIPCSQRPGPNGESSAGNCAPNAVANEYQRGCSAITRCRS